MSTVLIVDDEPDSLLRLWAGFEAAGHRSRVAADGESGGRLVQEHRPDVVVLDVAMPVMDGWALLRTLAADPSAPPVLAVSTPVDGHEAALAQSRGAAAWLPKPVDVALAVATVARLMASLRPSGY